MGLFHLARVRRHPAPALHAAANRGSRHHHDALPLCARRISRVVHPQLVLPVLYHASARGSNQLDRGVGADGAVFGLFLDLLHKVSPLVALRGGS